MLFEPKKKIINVCIVYTRILRFSAINTSSRGKTLRYLITNPCEIDQPICMVAQWVKFERYDQFTGSGGSAIWAQMSVFICVDTWLD